MGSGDVPAGYDESGDVGRPSELASDITKQENPFGKDRIGKDELMAPDSEGESGPVNKPGKDVSPLAENKLRLMKYKSLFPKPTKKIIFESKKGKDLLDESNILPEDNTTPSDNQE